MDEESLAPLGFPNVANIWANASLRQLLFEVCMWWTQGQKGGVDVSWDHVISL